MWLLNIFSPRVTQKQSAKQPRGHCKWLPRGRPVLVVLWGTFWVHLADNVDFGGFSNFWAIEANIPVWRGTWWWNLVNQTFKTLFYCVWATSVCNLTEVQLVRGHAGSSNRAIGIPNEWIISGKSRIYTLYRCPASIRRPFLYRKILKTAYTAFLDLGTPNRLQSGSKFVISYIEYVYI